MKWYYTTVDSSYYGETWNSTVYNVISHPILYNDVIYGTNDNRAYKVNFFRTSSTGNRNCYVYATSGIYENVYDWGRLIGSDNELTYSDWGGKSNRFYSYANKTIKGKYKFSNVLSGNMYGGWCIPLNYVVTFKDGTKITYNSLRAISFNSDYSFYKFCGIRFYDFINKTGQAFGSTTNDITSTSLSGNLVDIIIDFGDIPQNIPSFLYNWIIANSSIVYPYEYNVYSNDEIVSTIQNAPPMKKANLSVIDNTKILKLTGENDTIYTFTWVSSSPDNKIFSGLSYQKDSNIIEIKIGDTDISLNSNTNFYEVFKTYRPITHTFNLILYQNIAEDNRVDKTNYLTEIKSISGVMREESSLTDLSLNIEYDSFIDFNYIYIPLFNRYYYVTDITMIRYNLYQISLSVDVLMSYKDVILNLRGFVDRNENEYNNDIIDKNRVIELGYNVLVDDVVNDLFDTLQGEFIINGLQLSTYNKEE